MRLSLTGEWQFRAADEERYLQAVVPGCQFLDLMRAGLIPDPFVGVNESKVQWVHDKDYVYRKSFVLTEDALAADAIELVCRQLDTICSVTLNGVSVGYADNCHRAHVFDVKGAVRQGDNVLEMVFRSPKRYVEERRRRVPTPRNCNGLDGIVHIRKPQCHFGWDWGPVLTPVGIADDIYLEMTYGARLCAPEVRTRKEGSGYRVTVYAEGAEDIRLISPDGEVMEARGERATFDVVNPRLWWTRELSNAVEQPLYTVAARRVDGRGEEVSLSRKVGLRTIELDRSRDAYGYNFRFLLNGVPIFVKGANYIPPDCFITRFDDAKLTALLDAVQFSHLNMIRVWGGGYYADDRLLAECDRRGVLVWQDFMFACQAYPFFDAAFLDNVLREVDYNVKRMMSHPSLAVWCGNNEIEDMHLAWAMMREYVEWTETFFYHILPERLSAIDADTPYTPGSPIGTSHNRHVGSDFVGDTHLWGVWHGLKPMTYYRRRMTRFCSEFGFESLPSMRTVQSYATPAQYALSGATQRAHQKCAGGNDKMLHYIASRFHLSRDIRELIYLSQVTQQACIADATEHWRRHKGRCNGAMYWQLNDCWQTCSWSSYDYLGEYKALQYTARHFNAPLALSLEDTARKLTVHVLNDTRRAQTVEIEWFVFDFAHTSPTKSRQTVTVEALANVAVLSIDLSSVNARRQGVAVRMWQDGVMLVQKTHLLLPEKKLALPRAPIAIERADGDGVRSFTLRSPVYQRLVMVSNDSTAPFSDNYFDLLPDEPMVIEQDASMPCGETAALSVAMLGRTNPLRQLIARVKVYFYPRNIANALYHGRVPSERIESLDAPTPD